MFVVFDKQGVVVGLKEIIQLVLELHGSPHALFKLFILGSSVLNIIRPQLVGILVLLVLLANGVDVREPGELLPSTDGLQDSHILVVGVVACTELIEDIAKCLFPFQMLLVLPLERLEGRVMGLERLIESLDSG